MEAPLPATLRVVNTHGEVTVEGAETDRITLTLEKTIRRRDEPEARAVADRLHAAVTKDGQAVVITANRDDFRRRNFDTNFRLTVPAGLAVEVLNGHGTVKVAGVAAAAVVNRHGQVDASDIGGALTVENSYEDVIVDGVKGACDIKNSHAEVLVRRVDGGLTLDHAYGMATLRAISPQALVEGPIPKFWRRTSPARSMSGTAMNGSRSGGWGRPRSPAITPTWTPPGLTGTSRWRRATPPCRRLRSAAACA